MATTTAADPASLQRQRLDVLADLNLRRAALLGELDALAPSRRGEASYVDRQQALAGVDRRIARLTRPR